MSHTSHPLTLPQRRPRRDRNLNIRLSDQERAAVDQLAYQQGVSTSELARHFLLQAVAYYNRQMQGGGVNDPHSA